MGCAWKLCPARADSPSTTGVASPSVREAALSPAPLLRRAKGPTTQTSVVRISIDDSGNRCVNQYVIIRQLGRGSFGDVQLVRDTGTNVEYAMKILNKTLLQKRGVLTTKRKSGINLLADKLAGARREIYIHSHLDHRNVVALVEVLDDPTHDSLYLVVEYAAGGVVMGINRAVIDGPSLQVHPLNEATARMYFRDLVSGVDYLHRRHVVHRDIKPDNLLLSEDGILKISDFGVSRLFGINDKTASVAGTAAFMSPEQCASDIKPYSGTMSDIWSMGVTLYVFLYGRLPFTGSNVFEIYESIKTHPLSFPPVRSPGSRNSRSTTTPRGSPSEEACELLQRMLEKNPQRRIVMDEIREHPWVTAHGKDPLPPADTEILNPPPQDIAVAVAGGGSSGISLLRRVVMVARLKGKFRKKRIRLKQRMQQQRAASQGGTTTVSRTESIVLGPYNHDHDDLDDDQHHAAYSPPVPARLTSSSASEIHLELQIPSSLEKLETTHSTARRTSRADSLHHSPLED